MNHLNRLRKEIEQDISLPVLPSGISCLLESLNNDDIGYAQLAENLEKFPSIAVRIVAVANSAWAAPVAPITTLRDCCARVGVQVVRSIAIALTVSQVFDPTRCPAFNAATFWTSALLTAEAACLCAASHDEICPDTARLAGLFHNIGLLWLATHKPLETGRAISSKHNSRYGTLSEYLLEQSGIDLYTAGACLASCIGLPEIISSTIASPVSTARDDENPLLKNHRYAMRLASSVQARADTTQTATDNPFAVDLDFKRLAGRLADIQAMAQTLFFA